MNDRELLEKTHNLAQENHHILKNLQRKSRFGSIIKSIKWIIIILITIWSYTVIQPIIEQVQETASTVKDLQDRSGIGSLLNIFKKSE